MINLIEEVKKIKALKILDQFNLDHKKIIMIALVSAVIFYADFNFIFRLQLKGLGKSGAEAARLKKDLDNLKTGFKKMQDLRSREGITPAVREAGIKRIVSEDQFPALLQEISGLANKHEVKIIQLKPSREIQGANGDKRKPAGKLEALFVTLDLTCGYHNLGGFINGLENLPAFVKVREIRIEPQEKDYLHQRAKVVLITYVKK